MNNSTLPIVGYSVNDLYYENPQYCIRDSPNLPPHIPNGVSENSCKPTSDNNDDCPCTMNEYYGTILKQKKEVSDNEMRKYNDSTNEYNAQIVRTINYSIGVGMICAYLIRIVGE